MKIRTNFVTNSSSSSFVCIDIKSKKLKTILEKYSELLEEMSDSMCCDDFEIGEGFHYDEDELGYDTPVPDSENDVIDSLILWFEELVEEFDEFEDEIPELVEELRENKEKLTADIEEVDWTCSDMGWGGDHDARFNKTCYDDETLKEIYEDIMEQNGYESKEDVTEDDFCEYVSSQTSNEETHFIFNRKQKICKNEHSFKLI